ncbi:MAG: MFS transporter [Minicystis sp.]
MSLSTTGDAKLSPADRRLFVILGAPSLGLSLAVTVLATYLPLLARRFTSSTTTIGLLVGGEGLLALLVPIWAGALSDRVESRLGRRLPFLVVAGPVAVIALAVLPFAPSLLAMAVTVFFFYLAFFTYYAPYRALYPDLVTQGQAGRAQGIMGIFREIGLGAALVGGSLLTGLWLPLPYLVAAGVLLATTVTVVIGVRDRPEAHAPPSRAGGSPPAQVWALVRDHRDIRRFMVANALWELTMGGLKAFTILYLTAGLGRSLSFSAAVMGVIAMTAVIASPTAGQLADRHGPVRVMEIALAVFGLGLLVPIFSQSTVLLATALPLIAFGAVMALTLPYALLMRMMPAGSHGAAAGLFDLSGGAGTLLGPAITGLAIDVLRPHFTATNGYGAMWPVVSLSTLISIPILHGARPRPARPAP